MEAQEDGFPVDVEEKEAYFMSEVARGEQLAQEGMFWYFHWQRRRMRTKGRKRG